MRDGEQGNAVNRHDSCYFCGRNGFLFGEPVLSGTAASAQMVIEQRHEGWPGIPHGGVGIISLIELADHLDGWMSRYPWRADFRFGGDPIGIGSRVTVTAARAGDECRGRMSPEECRHDYLTGIVRASSDAEFKDAADRISALLAGPVRTSNTFSIPLFSERILFNQAGQGKNSHRFFEIRETAVRTGYLAAMCGEGMRRMRCDELNRSGGAVHPGVLAAMLDETLGWAGFVHAWQGGLTVEFSAIFADEVRPDERIYTVGRCIGMRGPHRKKLVECEGAVIALRGDREVPVIYARGRWLTTTEFKDRMLRHISTGLL
jgi:acyl-coenzyme A thioesterase PaaI-like protein